ncbi:MAG: hypothetical protein JWP47_2139 [Polaromonas sp.]|nr:hypothetical protein [Polaromonas sp.]
MKFENGSHKLKKGISAAVICLFYLPIIAQAWTLTLNPASRRVFLQVGEGTLNANNARVNLVSVTVPSGQLGSGVSQQMTSDSAQANSPVDRFPVCSAPVQVYVGGSYQRSGGGGGGNAALQVISTDLTNAAGDIIPVTEISWTTSTLGTQDATPNVIPNGSFTGGTQPLTTIPPNTYIENCHTFSYANTANRAAGTYSTQVRYTLAIP